MRHLSASSLDLAAICAGPFLLPGIDEASEDRDDGSEMHRQIATWCRTGAAPAHKRAQVAVEWLREHFPGETMRGLRSESSYAFDPATGEVRYLGTDLDRDYSAAPEGWIPGTLDIEAVGIDEVTVLDFKSPGGTFTLPAPRRARQLLLGAWCLAFSVGWRRWATAENRGDGFNPFAWMPLARVAFAIVSEEGVDLREDVIEPADWPGVLAALREPGANVERGRRHLEVVTGDHCGRCSALLACPATQQAVQSLSIGVDVAALLPHAPGPLVAGWLERWRHLKKIGDAVEERAKLLAREGLLPGWRLVQRERREIAGGIAHRVLMENYGGDVAREGVEVTTTQARIKAALRAARDRRGPYPRGWLTEQERAVWAALEAAGGIERKAFEVLVEDAPALPAEGAGEP